MTISDIKVYSMWNFHPLQLQIESFFQYKMYDIDFKIMLSFKTERNRSWPSTGTVFGYQANMKLKKWWNIFTSCFIATHTLKVYIKSILMLISAFAREREREFGRKSCTPFVCRNYNMPQKFFLLQFHLIHTHSVKKYYTQFMPFDAFVHVIYLFAMF